MKPFSSLHRPLPVNEFYILLSLVNGPDYGYGMIGSIYDISGGSVNMAAGTLYPLLLAMGEENLIEADGIRPAGKSGKPRQYYRLGEHGKIRLQDEAVRIRQALKILDNSGLTATQVPTDIQEMLLRVAARAPK
jgi:DNA-binding PadR family transcriptional regulator